MKFKEWFALLPEDFVERSVFKCIGWCQKWFFYSSDDPEEGCPANQLIEDITKKNWGPADYEIVHFDEVYYNEEDQRIWFILICNDGKQGVTTEQIREIEKKEIEEAKRVWERIEQKEQAKLQQMKNNHLNCEHYIKIKSLQFFGGERGDFCLVQKSGHPILFETGCCENCTRCSLSEKPIREFDETTANNKFGIWDFLVPGERWEK